MDQILKYGSWVINGYAGARNDCADTDPPTINKQHTIKMFLFIYGYFSV